MTDRSLTELTATEVVGLLRRGEVTPVDLLDALEARIDEVDGPVNALPTLCFDRARERASALMARSAEVRGPLAGLPVPIKDLLPVEGVPCTKGSPIFRDWVPEQSDILVQRLEEQGAIVYAKSNTPEFGAGANTFNEVFGATRNPWNTALSAAGSSGGAAVALATGMAWLAHGSDMGGSLRNPASFCGIVGLRPSPGRVAATPTPPIDQTLSVEGPMARNVEDLALLLDAMAGEDWRDPLSLSAAGETFLVAARSGRLPRRVAWSADLGITPVDPEVRAVCEAAARGFDGLGVVVEEAHPDVSEAHECFQVLRALNFAAAYRALLERHSDLLKPEIGWNIEKGLALTGEQAARAQEQRCAMFDRAKRFFAEYDLLMTPATIVPPFPVEQRYVEECAGQRFDNYVAWLAIAYAVTLLACPAISIPAGFTAAGLPVGLQIVGPPRGEHRLLAAANRLDEALGYSRLTPVDPRPAA
jgi:amidase